MEQFKIDNFAKDNPGKAFPAFSHLDDAAASKLRNTLARRLGMSGSVDGLAVVQELAKRLISLDGVDASEDGFQIGLLLEREVGAVLDNTVLINWYRFDDVDSMKVADLDRYFDDVWYPSSDDIDLVEPSGAWVISIAHHGEISVLKL
jgi:hypothetical protein